MFVLNCQISERSILSLLLFRFSNKDRAREIDSKNLSPPTLNILRPETL